MEKDTRTMQKIVQAFLLLALCVVVARPVMAQCAVRAVVQHASCYSNNGRIDLHVTGTAPFRFEWSNGQKNQHLSQLAAGKYAVTVTDAKGSKAVAEAIVQNTGGLEMTLSVVATSLTATVTGGTKPYQFVLNRISSSSKIQPVKNQEGRFTSLASGEYVLIVTDARGCSGVKNITIP